ncbi:MAG: Hsp20/alpha crystallin family protein [Rhizobiales bacterium]|nr:Hsp20/alpha crystallin family protein [Hyphomicrobiales bacterium]
MTRSFLPTLFGRGGNGDTLDTLHDEINRVFREFSRGWPGPAFPGGVGLSLDVAETDKALEITAEIPGVDAKDIDVSIANGILTIKGEKRSQRDEKTKDYQLVERSFGSFQRAVSLPFDADPQKIEAKFDKGVLSISVPKPPEVAAKVQKIAVKQAA